MATKLSKSNLCTILKLANQLEGSKTLKVLLQPYSMQHTCIYTHINKILIKLMYNWIIFAQMFDYTCT